MLTVATNGLVQTDFRLFDAALALSVVVIGTGRGAAAERTDAVSAAANNARYRVEPTLVVSSIRPPQTIAPAQTLGRRTLKDPASGESRSIILLAQGPRHFVCHHTMGMDANRQYREICRLRVGIPCRMNLTQAG